MSSGPTTSTTKSPIVVAVTGASGAIYAQRLVRYLLAHDNEVSLVVSNAGKLVIQHELAPAPGEDPWGDRGRDHLTIHSEKDLGASYCSGSFRFRAMVVIPATMGTVAAIASGVAINGIHRGADVALKERRRLVLVARETPFSSIHLENLLKLSRAGAIVLPPSPAFYQKPETVDDLVDFVVSRVLDALDIENEMYRRWKSEES